MRRHDHSHDDHPEHDDQDRRDRPPSIAEIAALTRRLAALSRTDNTRRSDEIAEFLADKNALLARIPTDTHRSTR